MTERSLQFSSNTPLVEPPYDLDDHRATAAGAVYLLGGERILLVGPTLTTEDVMADTLYRAVRRLDEGDDAETVGFLDLTGDEELRLRVTAAEPAPPLLLIAATWCLQDGTLTSRVTLASSPDEGGATEITLTALVNGTEIAASEPILVEVGGEAAVSITGECAPLTPFLPDTSPMSEVDWSSVDEWWVAANYGLGGSVAPVLLIGPEGDTFTITCEGNAGWPVTLSADRRLLLLVLGDSGLTLVNLGTGAEERVGDFWTAAFADDGTLVLQSDDMSLWVLRPGSTDPEPAGITSVAPPGDWLVATDASLIVAATSQGLTRVDLDDGASRVLVPARVDLQDCSPRAWWPDGRIVVACIEDAPWFEKPESWVDGPPGFAFDSLWLVSVGDGRMTRLSPNQSGVERPVSFTMAWPIDGGAILQARGWKLTETGPEVAGVYRMDSSGRLSRLDIDLPVFEAEVSRFAFDTVVDVLDGRILVHRTPYPDGVGAGMLGSVDLDGGDPIVMIPPSGERHVGLWSVTAPGFRNWPNREPSAL